MVATSNNSKVQEESSSNSSLDGFDVKSFPRFVDTSSRLAEALFPSPIHLPIKNPESFQDISNTSDDALRKAIEQAGSGYFRRVGKKERLPEKKAHNLKVGAFRNCLQNLLHYIQNDIFFQTYKLRIEPNQLTPKFQRWNDSNGDCDESFQIAQAKYTPRTSVRFWCARCRENGICTPILCGYFSLVDKANGIDKVKEIFADSAGENDFAVKDASDPQNIIYHSMEYLTAQYLPLICFRVENLFFHNANCDQSNVGRMVLSQNPAILPMSFPIHAMAEVVEATKTHLRGKKHPRAYICSQLMSRTKVDNSRLKADLSADFTDLEDGENLAFLKAGDQLTVTESMDNNPSFPTSLSLNIGHELRNDRANYSLSRLLNPTHGREKELVKSLAHLLYFFVSSLDLVDEMAPFLPDTERFKKLYKAVELRKDRDKMFRESIPNCNQHLYLKDVSLMFGGREILLFGEEIIHQRAHTDFPRESLKRVHFLRHPNVRMALKPCSFMIPLFRDEPRSIYVGHPERQTVQIRYGTTLVCTGDLLHGTMSYRDNKWNPVIHGYICSRMYADPIGDSKDPLFGFDPQYDKANYDPDEQISDCKKKRKASVSLGSAPKRW